MSDPDFERRLERMFAQPPRLNGGDAFTSKFEAKLDRGWSARRLLVGAAGAVGGVIAASQLINAELGNRFGSLSFGTQALPRLPAFDALAGGGLQSAALGGEVIWVAAAMLGLAAAFVATHWAESF